MKVEALVVTTTAKGLAVQRIANRLLNDRLAACVQTWPVSSAYVWQGQVVREPETMLTIKTRRDLYPQVEAAIREAHDYEVPEILATLAVEGSEDYLDWIEDVTGE